MFDYENRRVGFKGENIINFTEYYYNWKEKETVIKINESNIVSVEWTNEKIIMAVGAVIGGIILMYVIFFVIRNSKRNDANKIHSSFVEEVKDY